MNLLTTDIDSKKYKRYHTQISMFMLFACISILCFSGCSKSNEIQTQVENTDQSKTDHKNDNQSDNQNGKATQLSDLTFSHSMELQYAKNFKVDYYEENIALITIKDGSQFLVLPEDDSMIDQNHFDHNIVILQQPMQNIYLAATSAMCLFDVLDGLDSITLSGTRADGWYIENARQAMENGQIQYAGKYSAPDYELLAASNCTIAIESTMINHSPEVKEQLEKIGIPVMIDYASYEEHPLGRTEWMKLYGVLLGKEDMANALFAEQVKYLESAMNKQDDITQTDEYNDNKKDNTNDITNDGQQVDNNTDNTNEKTVAFFYISSNGYAVTRKSGDYVPKMISIAGGNYIFDSLSEDDSAMSTVKLEMEQFYATAKDADYIIYNGTIDGGVSSVSELIAMNPLLADFKAVQNGNVWCTNNNFYQETTGLGKATMEIHQILNNAADSESSMEFFAKLE